MKLVVTLLDFVVKRLVFNLKLFEVNQMETISELFLFLKNFFLVGKTIAQRNILQAVLVHLLVLAGFVLFPVLYHFSFEFLASARKNSILSYCALKVLKLVFNFLTLCLLLVQLGLQLTRHTIVSVLCLLQVVAHLMHIGEGI